MDLKKRFPHYSNLLRLYSEHYRKRYGEQMLQTLADMLDDAPAGREKVTVWSRAALDLPASIVWQQLNYAGETMTHQMPSYIKRNATISAALLVPFVLVLVTNGADKIINNRTLYHSWLWHMPILAVWVLWLPMVAAGIALASLAVFLRRRSKGEHTSWLRQLFNLYSNWPVVTAAAAGLLIVAMVFGHDTAQCVVGNPMREAHQWHQTWQCVQQNQGLTTTIRNLGRSA